MCPRHSHLSIGIDKTLIDAIRPTLNPRWIAHTKWWRLYLYYIPSDGLALMARLVMRIAIVHQPIQQRPDVVYQPPADAKGDSPLGVEEIRIPVESSE